jgi:hypothetical protein
MAKDRTDLVHRALRNLGVLPQGQSPSPEEYNSVDELIEPMIEDLIERDIIDIKDVDAIEEKYFLQLGHLLAWAASPAFGMQNDQALAAMAQKAEEDFNEMDRISTRYNHMREMRSDYKMRRA